MKLSYTPVFSRSLQTGHTLNLSQRLAYPLPELMVSFLFGPLVIVQGIYAKYFGVPLAAIATVLLISRLVDAITDPIIGYWSDRYYTRTGSRKPFVVAGAILFTLSSYFLYVPSSTTVSTSYFLGWYLSLYFAYTLFNIPHLAWGGELTSHSEERNIIFTLRSLALFLGKILFFAVPLLPFFSTAEFTPETLKWSVLIVGLLMLPALYLCVSKVPDGRQTGVANRQPIHPRLLLLAMWRNRPFLLYVATSCVSGIGQGMWNGLMFIFADAYLGLSAKLPLIFMLSLMLGTLSLSIWYKLANRFGKKTVWCLGTLFYIAGLVGIGLLSPGEASFIPFLLLKSLVYIGLVASMVVMPSLLADIVDYGTLKSGSIDSASYFSGHIFLAKSTSAIGGALGLAIASWYGFDATVTEHSANTMVGLYLGAVYLPIFFLLVKLMVIVLIPINARRHAIIRQRLDARAARAAKKEISQQNAPQTSTPSINSEEPCQAS